MGANGNASYPADADNQAEVKVPRDWARVFRDDPFWDEIWEAIRADRAELDAAQI